MEDKKFVIDIRKPVKSGVGKSKHGAGKIRQPKPKIIIREARVWPRYAAAISLLIIVPAIGIAAIFAVGFQNLKATVTESVPELYAKFKDAGQALANLETTKATGSFSKLHTEVESMTEKADRYGLIKISEIWGRAIPKLRIIPETFKNLAALTESSLHFALGLEELRKNAFDWLTNQKGSLITENLDKLGTYLSKIANLSMAFQEGGKKFNYPVENDLLTIDIDLANTQKFLSAVGNWFRTPEEKHFLIFFQNPSELRPAGGFLGSYADLRLNRNGLQEIKVWDIYDPDGQLELKIVPPRQLQGLTIKWGARDANWFFDFPTSAGKVITFLENSKIYKEQNIFFDGALAININVLETILDIVGPIELTDYKLTIDSANFLPTIQREIEAGRDNRRGEPKRILKIMMPILFTKIAALEEEKKVNLFKSLKNHFDKKDMMVYFKDWEIQNFFRALGLTGDIKELPENYSGDYLAVVSTNIAGGKSDAFVNQKIKLSSKILEDGRIDNFLIIERQHYGENHKDPWYRTPNKSYLKIFTPLGSRLIYMNGHESKIIKPKIDYEATGYLTDQNLAAIESTTKLIPELKAEELEESKKTVFVSWLTTRAGKTKKLEVEYLNPNKLTLNGEPTSYQFIFEKQSGAKTSLDFLIEAPSGYRFKENNEPLFNYVAEDPAGRLVIDLTLIPDLAANQNLR